MVRPEDAWSALARELEPLPAETIARREAAGRILADALRATVDVPRLDVSAMDGYALPGPVVESDRLAVAGCIAAGAPPEPAIASGRAVQIMTGAPVPKGADRVIPVELTERDGTEVVIRGQVAEGAHIRRRGEILRRGEDLLAPGALLTPGAMALLATHGHREVRVPRRPRVAFLATGDEVVPPEDEPRPEQIRDSHTDFLLAAAATLGLELTPLGIARDDVGDLREHISRGLGYDVLLLGGGVSMGEFDLIEPVLDELGCEPLFDSVAIQPGKPLVVARHAGGWVVGLPGNPASVMVCFWLFVRPLLRRLQGYEDGYWAGALAAELAGPLPGAKGRDRFLTGRVRFAAGRILVEPSTARGSHDLAAYARGTALVRVPAHSPPRSAGEGCEILPLCDWPAGGRSAG